MLNFRLAQDVKVVTGVFCMSSDTLIVFGGLLAVGYLLSSKRGTDALLQSLALAAAGSLGHMLVQGYQQNQAQARINGWQ
jgi:hypothetical protein